ncbi:ComEA family DNA-binding protein [Plebeiibacterium sediminum]|uniref:Helix-hairpin-helix domain-containing protein n=1 Tax=Plebeiibacterium sediminum TaxID=2992112 RepID=A0AAE3SDH0_9BACT|nr:helix-hairpin-helix domain-containing protein [Plebeiobacterium sediminum]MCW3784847.1 helix-hairpin-helix domain-containing protein [Plebeiobacterium sediminum]
MKKFILTSILFYSIQLNAQNVINNNNITSQIIEYLAENGISPEQNDQSFNDLIELSEHPININTLDKEFLERLLFLSDFQIQELLKFIKNYSPISSKYQLQAINNFSPELIETLSLFVTYGEPSMTKTKSYLKAKTLIRDVFEYEKPKGYQINDSSGYLGNHHHVYTKTLFEYGSNISCGFVYDKDPGEKFFDQNNKPEFLSGFAEYKSNKTINHIIIGDYHATFGQGLAISTGTNMGKAGDIFLIRKRNNGIKRNTSASEVNFLRGIASSLDWKSLTITTFLSSKHIDANTIYDSLSFKKTATSLPTTGYHRTLNELAIKNTLLQETLGANISYQYRNLSLSAGTYYQKTDIDSIESNELYKQLNPPSNQTNNSWLAYNYGHKNFIVFGELACNSTGNLAFINGILLRPTSNISTSILYRNISMHYNSPWINSITESSNPNGESGAYFGIKALPLKNLEIQSYIDMFKFRWLKYNTNKPSDGYELSFKAQYQLAQNSNIYILYKEKEKDRNISNETTTYTIEKYNLKKIRANIQFEASQNWTLQCRVEKSFYNTLNQKSDGTLAFANLNYHLNNKKFSCSFRYGIFDIENYDSRIYTYENDLLYNFSVPSFQDKGSRTYLLTQWKANKYITLWFKAAQTWYSNKKEIGSGLQTIKGNTKTNFKIQLQVKI